MNEQPSHTRIILTDSPTLHSEGDFNFLYITLGNAFGAITTAKQTNFPILSIIRDAATAEALSVLLEIPVPVATEKIELLPDDFFLVFQLNGPIPKGVIIDTSEVEGIGYQFGFLRKRRHSSITPTPVPSSRNPSGT